MSKPSLAIAHSMSRKKKKCASGGTVKSGSETMNMAEGGEAGSPTKRSNWERGVNKPMHAESKSHTPRGMSKAGHNIRMGSGDDKKEKKRRYGIAKEHHKTTLQEQVNIKGPTSGKSGFAHGGEVDDYQDECSHDCNDPCEVHPMGSFDDKDVVGQVMSRRMSKGGQVANDLGQGAAACEEENEFDLLAKEGGLEADYDNDVEIGSPDEDKRRKDVVALVMSSRRKRPSR